MKYIRSRSRCGLAFDLETHLIGEPRVAPYLIAGAFAIRKQDQLDVSWATLITSTFINTEEWEIYFFVKEEIGSFLILCEEVEGSVVAHNAAFDFSVLSAEGYVKEVYNLYKQGKVQCTMIRGMILYNKQGVLKTSRGKTSLQYQLKHMLGISITKDEVRTTYSEVEGLPFSEWPPEYTLYLTNDVKYLPRLYALQGVNGEVRLRREGTTINIFDAAHRRAAYHLALMLAKSWGVKVDENSVLALEKKVSGQINELVAELEQRGLAKPLRGVARSRAMREGKLL